MDKKDFIKKNREEIKKTFDYRDVAVSIDPADQLLAESTVSSEKIEYIKRHMEESKSGDLCEIAFKDGIVKLYRKDDNLYSGYFLDNDGQVEDKYDDVTPEILAKYLDMKNKGEMLDYDTMEESKEEAEEELTELDDYIEDMDESEYSSSPTHIKIKCGDFELEIRKSISDFIVNRKEEIKVNSDLKKAIRSYNNSSIVKSKGDISTAKRLLENWDKDKEGFFQMIHGIKVIKNK